MATEAWTEKVLVGHGFRQTAAKNTKINVSHRVDNLPFGQYEVRITRQTIDNLNVRQRDDMYLINIGEIIYDDLRYPNIALFGMKIKANDQLSGADPTISIKCTRSDVEVFNEEGVSQGFKSLSNPSWVAWDILTNQDYGAGYHYNRVEYPSFLDWANWNDEMVNNGYGGLEKRNEFNGVFDVDGNVWDSMAKVATTGRAGMFIKGTKYIPIVDKPSLPVQMFNMGNIKKGTFATSYMGTEDLATEVEIQFNNKDNAYAKDTLSVMIPEFYNQTDYSNKVTLNQMGVTSQSQAYRIGRYFLACNKYMYRTCTFETGVDALGCSIGDVVYVAHDVPAWGISGRTVGISTINSVVLDEYVNLVSGNEYTLLLRQNDSDVIDKRIFTALTTETTNHITVSSAFSSIPTEYSVFTLFQSTLGTQLFRVTNISRAMDTMDRKITLVDYNDSVLSDTTTKIPTTTSAMSLLPHVITASFKEHLEIKPTGALIAFIDMAWTCTGVFKDFDIMLSKDNGYSYHVIAKDLTSLTYSYNATELQEGRQYLFKIVPRSLNNLQRESLYLADVFAYTFMGKTVPPLPINTLSYIETQDDFIVSWTYADKPVDFYNYQVFVNGVLHGYTFDTSIVIPISTLGTLVTVYAVDTTKVMSPPLSISCTHTTPNKVEGISMTHEGNQQNLYWLRVTDSMRPMSYEIRKGDYWDYAQVVTVTTGTTLKSVTNGLYMIKALYVTKRGYKIYSDVEVFLNDGNYLSKNILAHFDEHLLWNGTKTHTMVYDGYLTLSDDGLFNDIALFDPVPNFDFLGNTTYGLGYYESTNVVTLDTPQLCKLSADYIASAVNMNDFFDSIIDFDTISNFNGYTSGDFFVGIEISLSQDGVVFSNWSPFINGDYLGKVFKFRLVLKSLTSGVRPTVSTFSFTVDMPDRFEAGIGVSPSSISFRVPFHIVPNTQITISNAEEGDDVELSTETNTGFTVNVINNGIPVNRNFNWYSSGY